MTDLCPLNFQVSLLEGLLEVSHQSLTRLQLFLLQSGHPLETYHTCENLHLLSEFLLSLAQLGIDSFHFHSVFFNFSIYLLTFTSVKPSTCEQKQLWRKCIPKGGGMS